MSDKRTFTVRLDRKCALQLDEQADPFRRHLRRLADPEGKADRLVDLTIGPHEDTRSAQANAYLWGVVYPPMVKVTGHRAEELHEAMKARFLTKTTVRIVNHETGEILEETVVESSRTTVKRFYEFVEQVRQFAAEFLCLDIPDPDPAYRAVRGEL